MKYTVGPCSKGHQNLVITDATDIDESKIAVVKKYAKSLGVYFNRAPRCYVCKEIFDSADAQQITVRPGDEASLDEAASAVHKLVNPDNA